MFYMYRDWRCGIETGLFVRATDVTKEHSAAQVTCYDIAANARGPSRVNVYIYTYKHRGRSFAALSGNWL